MAKNWYLKLEYRVWQSDPELSQCSLGARGFWLEMICAMHAQDTYTVTGSLEKIARMARCESSEVAKYALELKETNTANVTLGNGTVTLVSRRMKRELSGKEKNNLRVKKHRSNANVTVHSNSNSNSNSKKEEEPPYPQSGDGGTMDVFLGRNGIPRTLTPINPSSDLELQTWLAAVASVVGAKDANGLPTKRKWEDACMSLIREERDLTAFLKVVQMERDRNSKTPHFFSPDSCLKVMQMNGTVKVATKPNVTTGRQQAEEADRLERELLSL